MPDSRELAVYLFLQDLSLVLGILPYCGVSSVALTTPHLLTAVGVKVLISALLDLQV